MAKKLEIKQDDKFGKWIIIEEIAPKIISNKSRRMFRCQCECGNISEVQLWCLKNGHSTSCGCNQKRRASIANTKHGLTEHPLYCTWKNMKKRCNNPNASEYMNYGGRGIRVCEEWSNNFQSFYSWAISNGWSKELSIDRIDTNGNYYPENCRWSNTKTQMNNTTKNHYIKYNENTYTLSTLAKHLNIPYNIVRYKLSNCGWNVEQLINYWNDRN
jgi:hypothetical protein